MYDHDHIFRLPATMAHPPEASQGFNINQHHHRLTDACQIFVCFVFVFHPTYSPLHTVSVNDVKKYEIICEYTKQDKPVDIIDLPNQLIELKLFEFKKRCV